MSAHRWVSPLRYPGGKVRMTPWLVELFQHLDGPMDVELWLEPFGGGAGAALMALEAHGVPEAWIIEANPALAAFWTTLMSDGGRLAARVERTVPTLEAFDGARELVAAALRGEEGLDREELAFGALVMNRCSRDGMVHPRSGPIGGRHQTGKYSVASRFDGPRLAHRLRAVTALGSRFRPVDGDGIAHIEQLAGSGLEHEAFVFADPPYLGAGNSLYGRGMDLSAHQRLAAALRGCASPWALTYDAHPLVLELYRDHRVAEFSTTHTTHHRKDGVEYLVSPPHLHVPARNPMGSGECRVVAEQAAHPDPQMLRSRTTRPDSRTGTTITEGDRP